MKSSWELQIIQKSDFKACTMHPSLKGIGFHKFADVAFIKYLPEHICPVAEFIGAPETGSKCKRPFSKNIF
jgi:hypothetical protein